MHFQDDNRRFTHGTVTLIDTDGTKRPLTITAAGPDGISSGHGGLLRLERLGVRPVGR